MKKQGSTGWLLALILSVLSSLILGLSLVWLSIEKTDMAYSIRQLYAQSEDHASLRAKLEVERDRLLSPYELGRVAIRLGMREARAGQIRRIQE